MGESAPSAIDVERLVEDLKERLERERTAGAYEDDLSGIELAVLPASRGREPEPQPDVGAPAPRIRFRPELGFSSKPVIGPVITLVKKFFLRLLFYVFDDLARQTDAAVLRLEASLEALHTRLDAEVTRLDAEAKARERAELDIQSVSWRVDGTEAEAAKIRSETEKIRAEIEKLQLGPRLARLERARRPTPAPAPTPGQAEAAPAIPALDYERFEGRFRPEHSVRERQQIYVELLRGRKRVVDLGCGRGELIEMLLADGVSAYGVEIEPDFVALLEEKGIEVANEDAVAHLADLESGAVDGIVGSHLIEHLPPAAVTSLVALAGEKLADGGVLVLETPNPESLVAGSVNFHRDLTHVRPIHPDTLAFLCESAGFASVETRRLSPVPDDERLPATGNARLDEIVSRLNELIYGYQDYAVVARR